MKVLLVGGGAREHALASRIAESSRCSGLLAAPGNAGIAALARCLPVAADDTKALVERAVAESVDLVVVGPEGPLVAGLVDALAARGIAAFGPTAAAARLEGSKAFSKTFMKRFGIPTAAFEVFDDADEAERHVRRVAGPVVVKADGLAAGKGVVVASDAGEAVAAIRLIMRERAFGDAGAKVVIEERLEGAEASFHVVSDGERFVVLAAAQDHKRLLDGDRGPNTGGMGACSPCAPITADVERDIVARVVEPTLAGMRAEGAPFQGALFVGLMMTAEGPRVLEYNVRFGDPEAEVLMRRHGGDVLELLDGAARGDLSKVRPAWDAPAALAVVLASAGYPASSPRGRAIEGLEAAEQVDGVRVFHAGTALDGERIVTAGGRVLAVTAVGHDLALASQRAYEAVDRIRFEGMQYRRDIGRGSM